MTRVGSFDEQIQNTPQWAFDPPGKRSSIGTWKALCLTAVWACSGLRLYSIILAFTCSAGLVATQGAFGADKRSKATERFAFFVDGNMNTATSVTVEIGMGMDPEVYEWIRTAFDGTHITKNIEIHAIDFEGTSQSVHEFTDALITEVTLPTLDASSKDLVPGSFSSPVQSR